MKEQRPEYPVTEPFAQDWLPEAEGHRVAWFQSGNPHGIPALIIHGGPGSGSSALHRGAFDPARFRIIQIDQRGCGLSTPLGEVRHNHAAALVADMERLRHHLGIERWLVVGGSWGASLGLAYAGAHRAALTGLLLRGVFLTGAADMAWFFGGASALFTREWEDFVSRVPRRWRRSVPTWLDRVFSGRDTERMAQVATAWWRWEQTLGGARLAGVEAPAPETLLPRYRIQSHYLARKCHLGEAALLGAASRLHGLPGAILHGERDTVCPPVNAWRVHRAWGGSRLCYVPEAGHNPYAPPMAAAMRAALDGFADTGRFDGVQAGDQTMEWCPEISHGGRS